MAIEGHPTQGEIALSEQILRGLKDIAGTAAHPFSPFELGVIMSCLQDAATKEMRGSDRSEGYIEVLGNLRTKIARLQYEVNRNNSEKGLHANRKPRIRK